MRASLTHALLPHCQKFDFAFLTGDVGFMALEPLRDSAGKRFINAGIAEQNMVSVAAGLAAAGLKPWVYSIAPFLYARAFEQIRNDVCLHDLPVFLVGNGGGYAYGVMGPTHHAIEDYGALLGLPNIMVYVPAFAEDVPEAVSRLMGRSRPAYLRLGRDEKPKDFALPPYAPWRRVLSGRKATVVALGPVAGTILAAARSLAESERPSLWVVSELPLLELPAEFVADFQHSGHLVVVEEHVAQGSAGSSLAHALLGARTVPRRFSHCFARGYPSGTYGSQSYHRKESGLDAASILKIVNTEAHNIGAGFTSA
jgi:transketolase